MRAIDKLILGVPAVVGAAALPAYYYLLSGGSTTDEEDLGRQVEDWFSTRRESEVGVEVNDALVKLQKLDRIEHSSDSRSVTPIESACELLDKRCDEFNKNRSET